MQPKSPSIQECPVGRAVETVGEWWSILILRDAFRGLRRFDEFRDSLGIAPTMLTKRLNGLVEAGLLERRKYNEHPPRDEYVLTEKGKDFRPVLLAMMAFLLGLGMGCSQPVSLMLIYDRAPPGRSGEALGLRLMINNFTHIVVPILFGSLGTAFGVAPVFVANAAILGAGGVLSSRAMKAATAAPPA